MIPGTRGPFMFDAPYGAQAARLTDEVNAPQGCEPRLYPYWAAINNHRHESHLYVVVGRVGLRPLLLVVDKDTRTILRERELPFEGTSEGWYFSDSIPFALYIVQGNRLIRFDVTTEQVETVFTLDRSLGAALWQAHSSVDDAVHSATVCDAEYRSLGAVVFRNGEQRFFESTDYDECQIDKSGRYLVIQEHNDNRFIDLNQSLTRYVENAEGAVAHCDVGHEFVAGEDDQHEPGALVKWKLSAWGPREVIWHAPEWGPGMGHVAVRGNLAVLSSNWSREILAISLDDYRVRQIAPGMITGEGYDYQLRASVDPLGEWACWISNVDNPSGRLDLFLVKIGEVTVHQPGGSMKTLAIFPEPEDATAALRHDNGITTEGTTGQADGRQAQLVALDETQYVEGHGAWLDLKWTDGTELSQHGALKFKTRNDGRAAFEVDVFPKPKSF